MHLLGVRHETVGKKHLSQQIPQLPKGAKKSLYFLYSEFYLRANRNPFYLETINNADYLTTDGRGARWAQSKVTSYNFGPDIYQKVFLNSWGIIRIPAFILLFCIQLCANFLHGVYFFLIKKGAADSEDKLVLGRDYVYDLLHFANEQEWKVQIVAGARESKRKNLISKLQELYPHITIDVWSSDPDSDLMRDNVNVFEQVEKGKYCEDLTRENVLDLMPELSKAKKAVQKFTPDLLLISLGGGSGKQEFFIDNLKQDPKVNFRLATGIGAALDHLGTGAEQKKPPEVFQKLGLEWLYRFIFFPYRRKRIVDSILTFWFWVTLQTFSDKTYWRPTVINIASDDQGRVLLAQRRKDLIPGDIAWAFIQGGMDHISKGFFKRSQNENIKDIGSVFTSEVITNALRELKEETNLDVDDVEFEEKVYVQPSELYSISWLRFFYLGCQFKGQTKYILPITVKNSKNIRHNWEHTCVAWFRPEEVRHFIPPGKMSEWELYQDINQ